MHTKKKNASAFTALGTVLNGLLPKYNNPKQADMTVFWEIWDEAVGPEVAACAKPVAFKGDLLLVHVANSAWLHHLRFLEKELLEKLNAATDGKKVKQLKLKVGPV